MAVPGLERGRAARCCRCPAGVRAPGVHAPMPSPATPGCPPAHARACPPAPRAARGRRAAGLLLLSALCCASVYTSYLLAALHETPSGRRLNTYREMGEVLLGELELVLG